VKGGFPLPDWYQKRGLDVEERPPVGPGMFYGLDMWSYWMAQSALASARKNYVFDREVMGPRNRYYYAVKSYEAWLAWVRKYHARVLAIQAGQAARRLGFLPPLRK
jgi:hypothetical protein